jgi:acyl-CoA synthetase (NDP forming)
MNREKAGLDCLLRPASIAVIGASSDPTRIGGRPLAYLKRAGFSGGVYPVNPAHESVQGFKSYGSIEAVPHPIDTAIIAVRREAVLDSARACAAQGVKSLIVFSAGFAEIGIEGVPSQTELASIGRASGMRIIGPNSLGLFNAGTRAFATFSATVEECMPSGGRIAIATQSGGYGGYVLMMAHARGLDIGNLVTTGNECDVEVGEVIHWLAEDPGTEVILAYMEGCRNGASLIAGFEAARRAGKPVVVIKVGSTDIGAQAAASHTAALAGSDQTFEAVFKKYGVYRARHTEEMLDVAYALRAGKLPSNPATLLVTLSGGLGVHMSDLAEEAGLPLPPLPLAAQDKIKAIVPFASTLNPVDVTGQVNNDSTVLERCLDVIFEDCDYGSVLIFIGVAGSVPSLEKALNQSIAAVAKRYPTRLIAVCTLGASRAGASDGVLHFVDPPRAITALKACGFFAFQKPFAAFGPQGRGQVPRLDRARHYNEYEAKRVLASIGIHSPREQVAGDVDQVFSAAAAIGGKLALKIVSADLAHKSEVGGVILGLDTAEAASWAASRMLKSVRSAAPAARLEGFLVSEMVSGVECIIGIFPDPVFGPVMIFGAGGTSAELLKDVSRRLVPVTEADAHEMIRELRTFPLLDGFRGQPKADMAALARAIVAASELAAANADLIEIFEINPLVVRPGLLGCMALDCVLITGTPD